MFLRMGAWTWAITVGLSLILSVKGNVVTSTARISALYRSEGELLQRLDSFIRQEQNQLHEREKKNSEDDWLERQEKLERLQQFYQAALRNHSAETETNRLNVIAHPNGAFKTIQNFALSWGLLKSNASNEQAELQTILDLGAAPFADATDYKGACAALVRLQRVYSLSTRDMVEGKYEKYRGPPLSAMDAYDIGSEAVEEGFPREALEWLEVAIEDSEDVYDSQVDVSSALAKKGFAHIMLGNWEAATNSLHDAERINPANEDVFSLRMRVRSRDASGLKEYWSDVYGGLQNYQEWFRNFSKLCRRRSPVEILKRHHFCRYKCTTIPILRFKEMIVSLKPYASIFYDVISEAESTHVKQAAYGTMYQAKVGLSTSNYNFQYRTSDVNFLPDTTSPTVARLSRRIMLASGLDTAQRWPAEFDSSEPLQTVNYGIGGHYAGHMDTYGPNRGPIQLTMSPSSDRMATFLFYLSHVERGGNTVFTGANVAVPPVQYGALFWYNYTPQEQMDPLTLHAGCPVMVGEKWVSNKWIWHYGNVFRRPCPRRRWQSQWSVEKMLHTTC